LEIVRRAKTSKRALYEFFDSKQAILTALIRSGSQRMLAPPDLPPPTSREEFLATLDHFGRTFLAEFLHPDRMAIYRLAIAERGDHGGAVARELDVRGRVPVAQSVGRYFDQAAQRGLIARGEIPLLMYSFMAVLIGLSPLQMLIGTEQPPTPDVVAARAALAVTVLRRLIAAP
jgi:AcrR family transcriptional regulator